ncbi:hypothetical protein tb265_03590 [Gemmatimonadetes bacterium T265]|nr:hypothetical protein tb265_03590 [Gemmatimonadetes bacterium T265]
MRSALLVPAATATLLAAAVPARAQTAATPGASAPADPASVVRAARAPYEQVKAYLLRTAEQASDSDYAFRPTAGVRTLGQTLAHVAAGQYYYCGAALREQNAGPDDVEKTRTTKAAITEALRASFALCDRAYALTDAQALASMPAPGGRTTTPFAVLIQNVGHDNEHYGNLVTYLRLRGRVPPSSQPGA